MCSFLSCLFGSERAMAVKVGRSPFLSCLFGSERAGLGG